MLEHRILSPYLVSDSEVVEEFSDFELQALVQRRVARDVQRYRRMSKPEPTLRTASVEYICGCLAGAANVVTGYPFDTVKVRLQTFGGHSSPLAVAGHLYRSGGVRPACRPSSHR